ncbi:Tetraacyldisaccharide 4'-kinase [Cardinium endosymbiont cEper1 of Encarsia pergandiella]|uniref:tetraacyldisaccharide 4'-kinase n=1 Tax=Cardinium endosymbiont of Encarsia pergandiella TaxID=249402 RepID=UPI00027EAA0C|nr:tetraacyldisaccharide 4'-kinase [Cardinium endosymbiont of Encarsia pergandiella]CCM10474.1 Tetraacyldisaccharide 4'-kinase [Cardinium endosymbiont cEper1 of Encarsia pergandiella]
MFPLWLQIVRWGYGGMVALRHFLYNKKIKKKFFYKKPILISIGNLSVGGTGKTPLTIYLVKLLAKYQIVAVLSRGYKRKSVGFKIINGLDSALTAGDEPYLIYTYFVDNPNVLITVCENRTKGIDKIMEYKPDVEVILLDDGFQQLCLMPHLNILLTTFHQPFFRDHLLPLGRLREPRKGASRADIILVTKSPTNLSRLKMEAIKASIQRYYTKAIPIFFTHIIYHNPMTIATRKADKLPIVLLLVTGIAIPLPLRNYLETNGHKITHLIFPDHHWFNYADILKIISVFHGLSDTDKAIVTTEKDYVRLTAHDSIKQLVRLPIFYIPIEVGFLQETAENFEKRIMQTVLS